MCLRELNATMNIDVVCNIFHGKGFRSYSSVIFFRQIGTNFFFGIVEAGSEF